MTFGLIHFPKPKTGGLGRQLNYHTTHLSKNKKAVGNSARNFHMDSGKKNSHSGYGQQ